MSKRESEEADEPLDDGEIVPDREMSTRDAASYTGMGDGPMGRLRWRLMGLETGPTTPSQRKPSPEHEARVKQVVESSGIMDWVDWDPSILEDSVPAEEVTVESLQAFADAWNSHDVDNLMTFMTDDCVFASSAGPDVDGTRYSGWADVKTGFEQVFVAYPDAHWAVKGHFVAGDRGVSEWTFTATGPDGSPVEVDGCDAFTFRGGKIAVKNSFRKNRATG